MAKLLRNIRTVLQNSNTSRAIVYEVTGNYASVRLSINNTRYKNLFVVGGAVAVGDIVKIDFSANPPVIFATGETAAVASTASTSTRKQMSPSSSVILRHYVFGINDTVEVVTGTMRIHNLTGVPISFTRVFLSIDTPPTGADLIVDIHKNGVSIFAPSYRPTITAGSYSGESTVFDTLTWANGEYITSDVDQVGSITPGSSLVCNVLGR